MRVKVVPSVFYFRKSSEIESLFLFTWPTLSVWYQRFRQLTILRTRYISTFSFKTHPTNRLYMVRAKVLTDLPEWSCNAATPRAACSAKAASVSGGGRRSRPPRPPFTNRGVVNDTYQPDFPVETLIDRKCQ